MKFKLFGLAAAALMIGLLFQASAPAQAAHKSHAPGNPMIFVHGGSGSGAQWESQSQRFESNGYPANYVNVLEYDSASLFNLITHQVNTPLLLQIWGNLDQLIDSTLAQTGATQVDLLGHSLGTLVLQGYLTSSPTRAAKVGHYVNIDGQGAPAPPGGVPTLALVAGLGLGSPITGATNVTIPNQTHVECATSPESFAVIYKFFTGKDPATSEIIPEFPLFIKLSGRAVFFPSNAGVPDGTVQVWPVDGKTGMRLTKKPVATFPLSGDGSWGPVYAIGGLHYEFAVVRAGQFTHHFYYEPFLRDDHLIRLQTEPPNTGLGLITDMSPNQTDLIIIRYKELWGDQGANNDVLTVDGSNVISPATHPLARFINGTFVFDKGSDKVSHLGVVVPPFNLITFLTAVDLYIAAATPPNATVSSVLTPRDAGGKTDVINVPNWASTTDRVTLQFRDFSQDINSWLDYVKSLLR
ncbi:MAG: alpha/beta hydrolase [Dehalococcoidia bacterium]